MVAVLRIAAVLAAAIVAATPPARAQTISSNPRLYREWMRRETDRDLSEMYKAARELVRLLDPASPGDGREAQKLVERLVKRTHDAWSNVQMRKPTRERPKPDPSWQPRDLAAARTDAVAARDLVREAASGVMVEQRSRELDASQRLALLDTLERVEKLGLRLQVDLTAKSSR